MNFFKSCLNVILKRDAVFAVMNTFCFGSVFVAVLWAQFQFPVAYEGVLVKNVEFLVSGEWSQIGRLTD